MCTRMCMATKTITIMEDAYEMLTSHKKAGESFSEEIRRVFSNEHTRPLSDFFGILGEEDGDAILTSIEIRRKNNKTKIEMRKQLFNEIA